MGAFLDKPKTEKSNSFGTGHGLRFGIGSMQGWRVDMEDAHFHKNGLSSGLAQWGFFAVFDGHAGKKVADYSSRHLLDSIMCLSDFKDAVELLNNGAGSDSEKVIELMKRALRLGYLNLDESMRSMPDLHSDNERSGTTSVAVLLSPTHFFFINLGDSRVILSSNNAVPFATQDHKPYHPKERDRIVNAGGSVMVQRVNGSLAVSRALGDFEYKSVAGVGQCEQLVSPEPDVTVVPRNDKDEFLALACDGIFDVISNEELADFIRSRLILTTELPKITNMVLDACLSKGSRDNMSMILVVFNGAPQMNDSAVRDEQQLRYELEKRIKAIMALCDQIDDIDGEYVFRILLNQEIPGLAPGAGLHASRDIIDEVVNHVKENPLELAEIDIPMPIQPPSDCDAVTFVAYTRQKAKWEQKRKQKEKNTGTGSTPASPRTPPTPPVVETTSAGSPPAVWTHAFANLLRSKFARKPSPTTKSKKEDSSTKD